jgi:Ca-activated chloride channel family protein
LFDWLPLNAGQFTYFHFLRPWWLLALIPLLLTLRYLWSANNPMGKWRKIIAPELLKVMLVRSGRSSWFNPISVAMVVVTLGVVALAGPTWKQQPSPFAEDVAALVIALDVSSSMQQQDIQPSRLDRARQKVQDLLKMRPGGRVGLVVYAGSAHSVIPLTNDPDVVNNFLGAIEPEMMPRKGKFPEKALPIAQQMLGDTPVPGTVLMIGDGISPQTRADFEEYFSTHQHQLLVFGIGSETLDVSADGASDDALIPLERSALEKLANDNSGYYQSLTLDTTDVSRLNRRIDSHLVIVEDGSRPWVDSGYYLVYLIALIMLLWFRRGWTLHWCIVLLLVTGMTTPPPLMADDTAASWDLTRHFMDLWLTPNQQGRYYLQKGDYGKAAARFENIAWRGIAYYRGQNFKAAAEMFSRIETVDGYFNLANAWAHSRNYVFAVRTYDQVLELEPDHAAALKNRDKIQQIIDEINLLSASQQAEAGDSAKELGEGDPLTADGAERQDFNQLVVEQLSADEILLDENLNDLWMRQVQKNPARFLSVKFQMQLRNENSERKSGGQDVQ